MSEPDWTSTELLHRLKVQQLDPLTHEPLAELGVSGGSVSWDYYADARVSASLVVPDWTEYTAGRWLRLIHSVAGTDYERTLMTGYVWDDGGATSLSGGTSANPSLMGALKALQTDVLTAPITVAVGGYAEAVIKTICTGAVPSRSYELLSGYINHRYTSLHTIDTGTSRLSALYDVCDTAGDRLDVDGEGVVTIERYVAPSERTATMLIDADAPDTVVLDGVSRSTSQPQEANRVLVTWRDGDESVSGYADVSSTSELAPGRRGYSIAEVKELTDMTEPHSAAHAAELAATYVKSQASQVEWTVSTMWLPLAGGDVVMWAPPGEDARKCLVKSCDADLTTWTLTLTLKEV